MQLPLTLLCYAMLCYLPSYAMLCYAMLFTPLPPCMGNLSLMPYSLQLKNRASKFELCMEMFFGVFLLFHFHLLILLFRFCADAVDQSSHFGNKSSHFGNLASLASFILKALRAHL